MVLILLFGLNERSIFLSTSFQQGIREPSREIRPKALSVSS